MRKQSLPEEYDTADIKNNLKSSISFAHVPLPKPKKIGINKKTAILKLGKKKTNFQQFNLKYEILIYITTAEKSNIIKYIFSALSQSNSRNTSPFNSNLHTLKDQTINFDFEDKNLVATHLQIPKENTNNREKPKIIFK